MPLGRYRELTAKVDAFFARVHAAAGAEMECRRGCDACCRTRLTVTGVEAAAVRALLADLPAEARARLRARAEADDPARCPALEEDGACAIYAARPIVCRSHGLPIRLREPGSLPVIQACEKNFLSAGPAAAPAELVLDQATLSTLLAAVDKAHAAEAGTVPGERIDLARVLVLAGSTL